ncbi:MAG: YlxR family protein [Oscillospiraceae bacterium]|nr:YlxR family protein [Oscillospiraceae bacterium]
MNKKVPIRRCVGCRESKPKKELVRVVRDPDGSIAVDLTGKKSGRGAYVCRSAKCLQAAMKSKALARALECEIGEDIYARLAAEVEANGDGE